MRKIWFFAFAFIFLIMGASQVSATTIYLVGHNYDYNTAKVKFDYTYYGGTDDFGQIDIGITNTSDHDPIITGFTFNAPAEVTSLTSFTGPDGWTGKFESDSINTPEPFGLFDVAGITSNNTNNNNIGGGDPQDGIPVGNTYNFNFIFDGTGLGALTEASFLDELSLISVNGDETAVSFLARIQQVGEGGGLSDVMIPGNGGDYVIPEPATAILFGAGLLFLAGVSRKRRR